ncbi:DUF6607 family protein [Sphingomonas sanxanigenens]|uniref:DUF6607 family protein n=1 Tax=Sphingomonas sanxanigenens TaxID=397260 RepID=UPI00046D3853|nr:DUF6607 family protein [Sphingomonas sanxanigenens]
MIGDRDHDSASRPGAGGAVAPRVVATAPAGAQPAAAAGSVDVEKAKFEADRAHILAMAGNYKVTFDMRETTPWLAGYEPIEPKISGGHEIVRLVEDSGRKIVLQHILVAEHGGQTLIIKHWRQDWVYEPADVLVYAGPNQWKLETVPERFRKGRWSQTVWQTDDSPRYGGWGEWTGEGGVPRWRSNWTLRPLARRDAVRKPVYDRYQAINRHSPTPTGWIHWQDNIKLGMVAGKLTPIVQESLLNTYERFDGYKVSAGDAYWAKTKAYWGEVRKAWDAAIVAHGGVTVKEEAETGSVTGLKLMGLADEIAEGKKMEAAAVAEARTAIMEATKG